MILPSVAFGLSQLARRTGRRARRPRGLAQAVHRLTTPGLAQGFAANDVIEVDDQGAVAVVERAGNVGVQFLSEQHDEPAVNALVDEAERLGGWLDASTPNVVAISLPARAGFPAIEALAQCYAARAGAGVEWFYANVYQEDGETPHGSWGRASVRGVLRCAFGCGSGLFYSGESLSLRACSHRESPVEDGVRAVRRLPVTCEQSRPQFAGRGRTDECRR